MKKIVKLLFDEYSILTVPTLAYAIITLIDVIKAIISNDQPTLEMNVSQHVYMNIIYWMIGAMMYGQKSTHKLRFGVTRRERNKGFLTSIAVLNIFVLSIYAIMSMISYIGIQDKNSIAMIDYFSYLPPFFIIINTLTLSTYYVISRLFKNYHGHKMSMFFVSLLLGILGLCLGIVIIALILEFKLDMHMPWWLLALMVCFIGVMIHLILQTKLKVRVLK